MPSKERGTSTRGRKPAVKPKFTGRTSKEEREARERAQRERDHERKLEHDAEARLRQQANKAKNRGGKNDRGGTKSRGGYSGPLSGPFSLGPANQDRRRDNRPTISGSRATRIKSERDGDEDGGVHKSEGRAIRKEDGGDTSSEDDEMVEYPRKDIDLIEISSDENEDAGPSSKGSNHLGKLQPTLMPIRIGRREHQDRVFGINPESSAGPLNKAVQSGESSSSASGHSLAETVSRKSKAKAKDVEITGVRRPYKGMWQDVDEADVQIKAEPISNDEDEGEAEEVGAPMSGQSKAPEKQMPSSPEAEKKPKIRSKLSPGPGFVIQTDEDRAEWKRFQDGLLSVRNELGPEVLEPAKDAAGDVAMQEAGANDGRPRTVRDNNVYLFQFPPVMPDLLTPTVKNERSNSDNKDMNLDPPATAQKGPVVVKDDPSEHLLKPAEGLRVASGRVGKLRVYDSGRTTLDWGGTSFELSPGHRASFLQEVVTMNITPEKTRDVEDDGGEAVSFGRVKGKFVVTPDLKDMLG